MSDLRTTPVLHSAHVGLLFPADISPNDNHTDLFIDRFFNDTTTGLMQKIANPPIFLPEELSIRWMSIDNFQKAVEFEELGL